MIMSKSIPVILICALVGAAVVNAIVINSSSGDCPDEKLRQCLCPHMPPTQLCKRRLTEAGCESTEELIPSSGDWEGESTEVGWEVVTPNSGEAEMTLCYGIYDCEFTEGLCSIDEDALKNLSFLYPKISKRCE